MSQEDTKRQEEATQDKESTSTSTKATPSEPTESKSSSNKENTTTENKNDNTTDNQNNNTNDTNEELIIDQVRSELETYFAPQNIQNDFNLRQKMTTDGYIDIDLLLDLKLISDLARNRDILIEAISRSKLLVMNTGCTMVKYMPLLERNVLILRDIATSTKKEEILSIFDNENCSQPSEVHSDIGNNWFCQFKTEEECLTTAKYLQQYGTFNQEKLHVRVKAIHDKNKADTSPQMAPIVMANSPVNKPKPPPMQTPPQIPYSQGYYQNPSYTYYGPPPQPIDPYYGYVAGPAAPQQRSSPKSPHRDRDRRNNNTRSPPKQAPEQTTDDMATDDAAAGNTTGKDEERTAISDYPGVFDKYAQTEFLDIYKAMTATDLDIPQSMRGRDFRIISEEALEPNALTPKEDKDKTEDEKEEVEQDSHRKRKKGRKKQKQEIQGTYYEEEVYDETYDEAYDETYNGGRGGGRYNKYDNKYENTYAQGQDAYYYEEEYDGGGGKGYDENEYYYDNRSYYNRNDNRRSNNKYYYGTSSRQQYRRRDNSGGGGRGRTRGRRGGRGGRARTARQYQTKKRNQNQNQSNNNANNRAVRAPSGKHWSPRQAKIYNTNKGVYRTKTSSSNAY